MFGQRLSFPEAAEECLGLGEGWDLPVEFSEDLKQYLINKNIRTSWTGLIRKEFSHWRWINGSIGIHIA